MIGPATRAALVTTVLSLGAYFAFAAAGWPGSPSPCIAAAGCFCEAPHPGAWFVQPANTLSALGFVVVAFALARRMDRDPSTERFWSASYASVVVFLGPGAMYFHGSLTAWGGVVDAVSMYLYATWLLAHRAHRDFGWSRTHAALGWLFVNAALAFVQSQTLGSAVPIFAALITAVIVLETRAAVRVGRPAVLPLSLAGVFFALALAIWLPSRDGYPLCFPDSLLQGHAAWHLLTALATGTVWVHLEHCRAPRD